MFVCRCIGRKALLESISTEQTLLYEWPTEHWEPTGDLFMAFKDTDMHLSVQKLHVQTAIGCSLHWDDLRLRSTKDTASQHFTRLVNHTSHHCWQCSTSEGHWMDENVLKRGSLILYDTEQACWFSGTGERHHWSLHITVLAESKSVYAQQKWQRHPENLSSRLT